MSPSGKWLITGIGGKLGGVLHQCLYHSHASVTGTISPTGPYPSEGIHTRLDLTNEHQTHRLLSTLNPDFIIHTAAISGIAPAYKNPQRAYKINVDTTERLSSWADKIQAAFIFLSTDMVFDGENAPYDESTLPHPQTVYGKSKYDAEKRVLEYERGLVIRLPLLYGFYPVERDSYFLQQVTALKESKQLKLIDDEFRTPMSFIDAANSIILLALSGLTGIIHLAGPQRLSRLQMGQALAAALQVTNPRLEIVSLANFPSPEPRPRDLSLLCNRFIRSFGIPPGRTIEENLQEMLAEL